jgi:hypothetical protein
MQDGEFDAGIRGGARKGFKFGASARIQPGRGGECNGMRIRRAVLHGHMDCGNLPAPDTKLIREAGYHLPQFGRKQCVSGKKNQNPLFEIRDAAMPRECWRRNRLEQVLQGEQTFGVLSDRSQL